MKICVTVLEEGKLLYEWTIETKDNASLNPLAARSSIIVALEHVVKNLLVDSFCPDFVFKYINHMKRKQEE